VTGCQAAGLRWFFSAPLLLSIKVYGKTGLKKIPETRFAEARWEHGGLIHRPRSDIKSDRPQWSFLTRCRCPPTRLLESYCPPRGRWATRPLQLGRPSDTLGNLLPPSHSRPTLSRSASRRARVAAAMLSSIPHRNRGHTWSRHS
jgi:hypothetical protein